MRIIEVLPYMIASIRVHNFLCSLILHCTTIRMHSLHLPATTTKQNNPETTDKIGSDRLLERVKHEKEEAKKAAKTSAKRKKLDGIGDTTTSTSASGKKVKASTSIVATKPKSKSKAALKAEATDLVERINAVVNVNVDGESNSNSNVYDSCPQVVTKMKAFLQRDGMTKSLLLSALGNINNNSLNRFMASKKQDQCGNIAYRAGYVFFEKLRILEGKPKSSARIKNEANNPEGFSVVKERAGLWVKHLPLAPWE